MGEKTTVIKDADTSTTKVIPDTCCVVSTYSQPPLYISVHKKVSNEAQVALYLLIREMELIFVFWYEQDVVLTIMQSTTEYYFKNADNINTRRILYVRVFSS